MRPKDLVDQADAFDELSPIEPRDQTHARNHVPDGHVDRRLALMFEADQLLGSGPLAGQELLQPAEGRRDRWVLIAQALEELDAGRPRKRILRDPLQRACSVARAVGAEAEEVVGELVRLLSCGPAAHDLLRHTPEVVDEEDPKTDRDRPELADRQRHHLLIGEHHSPQAVRFEAAVRMRDVGPDEPQNPRVAREMAFSKLGEPAVVVLGQVVTDLAKLLVNDVIVVDEPFGGRRNRPFVLDRPNQGAV